MRYHLLNKIEQDPRQLGHWLAQDRVLTLAPMPRFFELCQLYELQGINLVDAITQRTYDRQGYRFFNDGNTPSLAKIEMMTDGSIMVIHNGTVIGREYIYPNTRRAIQDIRYTNPDGSLDYIEEYASDGQVYSNIFYYNDDIQEIVFFNTHRQAVLHYYFYHKLINYITVEDPLSHQVRQSYANVESFAQQVLGQLLQPEDIVIIHYLGIELSVLSQATSHNWLQLTESPFDEQHQVRGNLQAILENRISYISKVLVLPADYQALDQAHLPLHKVEIIR